MDDFIISFVITPEEQKYLDEIRHNLVNDGKLKKNSLNGCAKFLCFLAGNQYLYYKQVQEHDLKPQPRTQIQEIGEMRKMLGEI